MQTILIRIPAIFKPLALEILSTLGQPKAKALGSEYFLIKGTTVEAVDASPAAPFISWQLPLSHLWPCHPADNPGFLEKAAQALFEKYGPANPQGIWVGSLNGGQENSYYRSLGSNLRGRLLQVFPRPPVGQPEAQDPLLPSLYCMVGREGLYAGLTPPRETKGFFPGGTRHMRQSGPEAISRAGAKIAEALHQLKLYSASPRRSSHWLELGASPGGMTRELLDRHFHVTAVDRAPLDKRLAEHPRLRFIQFDVATFEPRGPTTIWDSLLCDMNGDAHLSLNQVLRLSEFIRPGGLIVFTAKTPTTESYTDMLELNAKIQHRAKLHGLELIAYIHLTYNRREFTILLRTPGK